MEKLLFFSQNCGKISEVQKLFKGLSINLISLKDLDIKNQPNETGKSFPENARIKSMFGHKHFNIPCFADDSGICVEALDWKPGVLSKNYLESFETNVDCLKNIINQVKQTGKKKALFKTSICLTLKENYHIVFEGKIEGEITSNIIGGGGFGYDPIFIPKGHNETFAEMSTYRKNLLSHRSIAISKLINFFS